MFNNKTIWLAAVMGVILLIVLTPAALAYPVTMSITSNLDGFRTVVYKCVDSGCTQLEAAPLYDLVDTDLDKKNQYTITGSGTQYIAEFSFAPDNAPRIYRLTFNGSTTQGPFDHNPAMVFSQLNNCLAPIQSFNLRDSSGTAKTVFSEGELKDVLVTTKSPFTYPTSTPVKIPDNLTDVYSPEVEVSFIIEGPNFAHSTGESKNISINSTTDAVFVPPVLSAGTYNITSKTKTKSPQCNQSTVLEDVETLTLTVVDVTAPSLVMNTTDLTTVEVNNSYMFQVNLVNNGNETAQDIQVSLNLQNSNIQQIPTTMTSLEAGQSTALEFNITTSVGGTYDLVATAGYKDTKGTQMPDVTSTDNFEVLVPPEPPTPPPEPPPQLDLTAKISVDKTEITEGESIVFNASDSTGSGLNYYWDFADESQLTPGIMATHQFEQNGTYNVTLTVQDSQGLSDIDSIIVTVNDTKPTANFIYSPISPVEEGTEITFTSTSSSNTDNPIEVFWLFGDEPEPNIKIVSYIDYESPFSGELWNPFATYTLDFDISQSSSSIEFKHFPLEDIHPNARNAALAAECARDDGLFFMYSDLLFDNYGNLSIENLKNLSVYLNNVLDQGIPGFELNKRINTTRFNQCLDNREKDSIIDSHISDGLAVGVPGTPTTFVNNVKIVGALPTELLAAMESEFDLSKIEENRDTVPHTYAKDGKYQVLLLVKDSDGSISSGWIVLTVADSKPNIVLTGPSELFEGQIGTFDASGTTSVDGVTAFEWDTKYNESAGFNPSGLTGDTINTNFDTPGDYLVAVRVKDTDGSVVVDTHNVKITPSFRDVEVTSISQSKSAGQTIYLFDNVTVSSNIVNNGASVETVTVNLRDNGKVVSTKTETLGLGESKQVDFSWIPNKDGLHTIAVEILPISAGESNTLNNKRTLSNIQTISVANSLSLEFFSSTNYPSSSAAANSKFYVWVKVTNTLPTTDLSQLSINLSTAGLVVSNNKDGNIDTVKTYDPLSFQSGKDFWWELDSGTGGIHNIIITVGNPSDQLTINRVVTVS